MSRTFDVARPPRPALGGQKRSYFISRLLREVVFAEAGLVNADPRAERRRRRIQYGLYAGIAAVVAAAGILWTVSYGRNVDLIENVRLTASSYAAEANTLKLDRVDSADLRPVVPLLQKLREIPTGYASMATRRPTASPASAWTRATSSGCRTRAAYRHALNTLLLPRLVLRLETVLAGAAGRPGVPLRGAEGLSDAGPAGAAAARRDPQLDGARLGRAVSRRRRCRAAPRAGRPSRRHAGKPAVATSG